MANKVSLNQNTGANGCVQSRHLFWWLEVMRHWIELTINNSSREKANDEATSIDKWFIGCFLSQNKTFIIIEMTCHEFEELFWSSQWHSDSTVLLLTLNEVEVTPPLAHFGRLDNSIHSGRDALTQGSIPWNDMQECLQPSLMLSHTACHLRKKGHFYYKSTLATNDYRSLSVFLSDMTIDMLTTDYNIRLLSRVTCENYNKTSTDITWHNTTLRYYTT